MDKLEKRLRSDPEAALSELMNAYTGLVYAVVKSVLCSAPREEIEECVGDVFTDLYRRREKLDFSTGSVKAYLCAAAKGMAVDRLRKLAKAGAVPLDTLSLPSDAPTPEQAAVNGERRDALLAAIRALGEPAGSIVVRRYYFNQSSREIAKAMGMKENAVDQRLSRARKTLSTLLKGGY